jgi:hypothetical protein
VIPYNLTSLHLSPDASIMEHKIQSLPQELRTHHPQTWTTETVFAWVTGWGRDFNTVVETLL